GAIYDGETGEPIRILGNNADITERKHAELILAQRNAQLALAGQSALVGSFSYESDLERMTVSEGYATMHGLPKGTTETTRSQWRARVHADDLERIERLRARTFCDKRDVYILEYRIVRNGEVRWIESRSFVSYNGKGQPQHVTGINIDITERKQAELALAERNLQFALAGRANLGGSYAYDTPTERVQVSEGDPAVHRFPPGTTKIARSQWLAGVHPEDVEVLESRRDQAFRQRQVEYSVDYRILLPGHGVRWIEARSFISYGDDAHPQRVVGVIIDVTKRRQT